MLSVMVIERIVFVPSVTSRLPPPLMATVASAAEAPPLALRPFWIAVSACVIVIGLVSSTSMPMLVPAYAAALLS